MAPLGKNATKESSESWPLFSMRLILGVCMMLQKFSAEKARFLAYRRTIFGWSLSVAAIGLGSCGGLSNGSPATSQLQELPAASNHVSAPRSGGARSSNSTTTDWDSFGFDLQRTGYNPYEATVGVNNVGSLQEVWSSKVGGGMVHEPVYAYGVPVGSTPTNVLYAGSNLGATMYALNAQTGAVIWKFKVSQRSATCEGSSQEFAIGETPAIDRGKNLIYFSGGYNQIHAVNLATGKEAKGWPLSTAWWPHDQMHGGFTYNPADGLLYGVTSSMCGDASPWHGRIVVIYTNGPFVVNTFYPMSGTNKQGASGGGIWGPGGASIDPVTNDVFIATGNADTNVTPAPPQNASYAEEVVELSPLLSVLGNNYPSNIPNDGLEDFDFGATPMLFQPAGCPPLLAAINKSGMFELYDRASISSGPIQDIAMSVPSSYGNFVGVPAYDPATGFVYVGLPAAEGIYQPGIAAFSMASNCTLNTTPVWSAQFGPAGTAQMPAPRSPISIANGVVYVSNYTGDTEYAFNAATGAQLWTLPLPYYGRQGTVIANGMVYVSSWDGTITAWAPRSSAPRLRKKAVNGLPPVRGHDISIPDGKGGTIDLRSSPNALANFGLSHR